MEAPGFRLPQAMVALDGGPQAPAQFVFDLGALGGQAGLLAWYGAFTKRPPVCLVHGEPGAQQALATALRAAYRADVRIPARGDALELAIS